VANQLLYRASKQWRWQLSWAIQEPISVLENEDALLDPIPILENEDALPPPIKQRVLVKNKK
jgi:hypothetical protein